MNNIQEQWHQIKSIEEKRRLRSSTIFLRNRAFWKELVNYQRESYLDGKELLEFMKRKQGVLSRFSKLLKDYEQPNLTQNNSELTQRKSAGYLAKKAVQSIDDGQATLYSETAQAIDREVVQTFTDRLTTYQQERLRLSDHAKTLFVAWILLDGRVHDCYQRLLEAVSGGGTTNNPSAATATTTITSESSAYGSGCGRRDKWILYARYCLAVQKFESLMNYCHQKFHLLFNLARDMESARVHFITRSAELFLKKLLTLSQQGVTIHSAATGSLASIQQQLASLERPLHEELAERVMENSPERANFSLYADYLLHRSSQSHDDDFPSPSITVSDGGDMTAAATTTTTQQPGSSSSSRKGSDPESLFTVNDSNTVTETMGGDNTTAPQQRMTTTTTTTMMLSHPLQNDCFLYKAFLFLKEESNMLYGSLWSPILVLITKDKVLHYFDLQVTSPTATASSVSVGSNTTNTTTSPSSSSSLSQSLGSGKRKKYGGILGAYQSFVQDHNKQCYEDDLIKPFDPTLRPANTTTTSAAAPVGSTRTPIGATGQVTTKATTAGGDSSSGGSSGNLVEENHRVVDNDLFYQLIQTIDWKDIEENNKAVIDR
eukprot:scaffold2382_cov184-Ochromonas_danica.AAC.7